MDESTEIWAKLGLCVAAAVVVALRHRRRSGLRPEQAGPALLFMAFLSLVAYTNFRTFHGGSFVHHHEHFHYFLSAKYFPELGYDGLYVASLAAQRQAAPARWSQPTVQDLRTNRVVAVADVEPHLRQVVARFSPARWREFVTDHGYFLAAVEPRYVASMRLDHGFNATPTWAFVGRSLSRWLPASERSLTLLAGLDLLLLAAAFAAVFRAYGARVACLSLIVFGLSYPSRFHWTGGGFLRQDWLAAAVGGICLLRRGRAAAAGALLGYAATVRLFPVLLLFGPALVAIREWRRGADTRWVRRLAAGFLGAVAVGLVLGAAAGRGAGGWSEFARDVSLQERTWLTNNVGLTNVLTYDEATVSRRHVDRSRPDPWQKWEEAMETTRRRRQPYILLAKAVSLGLAGLAVWSAPLDAAAVLSLAAPFALTLLTCYYWSMLMVVPLRSPAAPATVALLLLNAALYAVHLRSGSFEMEYAATSWALALFFTAWVAPAMARLRRRAPAGPA
jgi:hypothetical protein